MLTFLGRRLLQLIPTLFFVSVMIFALQHCCPATRRWCMAGEERDPSRHARSATQYRLDEPIPVRYVYWVKGVLSRRPGRIRCDSTCRCAT